MLTKRPKALRELAAMGLVLTDVYHQIPLSFGRNLKRSRSLEEEAYFH
ncbi:MAG: hypothetical protein WAP14_04820 [Acetomicrobium sp.]